MVAEEYEQKRTQVTTTAKPVGRTNKLRCLPVLTFKNPWLGHQKHFRFPGPTKGHAAVNDQRGVNGVTIGDFIRKRRGQGRQ